MAADQPPQLQPRGGRRKDCVAFTLTFAVMIVFAAAVGTGAASLSIYLDLKYTSTVFTVAITGVTGLDDPVLREVFDTTSTSLAAGGRRRLQQQQPAAPAPPPRAPTPMTLISPVFNLTFQIDNTANVIYDTCVPVLSRADVSYGDAFLAGGSVPPLCAGEECRSDRVVATARGENVAVPRSVRDLLAAGDVSVDVKVTMPTCCRYGRCRSAVLSCKPKIRGGRSKTCRLDPPRSLCEYFNLCY